MKKLISLVFIGFFLTGLSGCIQKIAIEQGNIICDADVNRLRVGMSEDQVKEIMGNPVLINLFSPGRLDYVYTYQLGQGRRTEKRMLVIFVGGRLREIVRC